MTKIVFMAALLFFAPLQTQPDWWQTLLSGVKYANWQQDFSPKFNEKVRQLNGKEIEIKGFLIPLEKKSKHNFFLLSAFPFDACFYCGKAGPESVIEVRCKKAVPYSEKLIKIKGTLKINDNDPVRLFYLIDDGVFLE